MSDNLTYFVSGVTDMLKTAGFNEQNIAGMYDESEALTRAQFAVMSKMSADQLFESFRAAFSGHESSLVKAAMVADRLFANGNEKTASEKVDWNLLLTKKADWSDFWNKLKGGEFQDYLGKAKNWLNQNRGWLAPTAGGALGLLAGQMFGRGNPWGRVLMPVLGAGLGWGINKWLGNAAKVPQGDSAQIQQGNNTPMVPNMSAVTDPKDYRPGTMMVAPTVSAGNHTPQTIGGDLGNSKLVGNSQNYEQSLWDAYEPEEGLQFNWQPAAPMKGSGFNQPGIANYSGQPLWVNK